MSNFRNTTGHVPLRTSMTNSWKSKAATSDVLEKQTRALEESLNKLKLAMHPDKTKSTVETNGPIWDKGKAGPLSQYVNHVLRDDSRRTFDANKPTKIRVLGDEPPATVPRPSLVANLFSNKPTAPPTTNTKFVRCGQCEKDEAKMKCLECAESYCASCFAHFHLRGALQRHRCVPLAESRPATPQKRKPPVGADVIFKELRVAQSKDNLLKSTVQTDVFEYNDDDMESDAGQTGGDLLRGSYDEKVSAESFQQALAQWRQGGGKKTSVNKNKTNLRRSTHEAAVDTSINPNVKSKNNPIPNIEFSSSKLTYAEKLLVKKYRRTNQNDSKLNEQQPSTINGMVKQQTAQSVDVRVNRSVNNSINLNRGGIDIEDLYDDLPTAQNESARTITADDNHNGFDQDDDDDDDELIHLKQQERSKSRSSAKPLSRPNSSATRKNSISSRPGSAALFQHPLPSLLSANPSDELKTITSEHQTISRPSSAALKKPTKLDYRIPTVWNRNWKPEQSVADGVDLKSVQVDQQSVAQFDLALNDLLDEDKIEESSRLNNAPETSRPPTASVTPRINVQLEREKPIDANTPTPTPTPRRTSPFNFSSLARKIESSSSMDAAEGGFFTDVVTRKSVKSPAPVSAAVVPHPPPPVVERSPSNEWKQLLSSRSSVEQRPTIPSLSSLRKASIESLTRPAPKRSMMLEETHQQMDDQSRPGSSLSSASLPVSIISSKPEMITQPSLERRPRIKIQAAPQPPPAQTQPQIIPKKVRVEFSKKSAQPDVPTMVVEGKKVTSARNSARNSDENVQQSILSTRNKISSGVQKSQNLMKASSTSSMTSVTRDDNILRDESLTITDMPVMKSGHRRSTNVDRESTKSRKIEFSVRDGMKWQQASTDLRGSKAVSLSGVRRSSKITTPRPSTPSNPINSKLAQQYNPFDDDDGRSSRACQDVDDEECFNQLREELCSELGMTSPGFDASLSEHVLKNLRTTNLPLSEKELEDNLTTLEMKLRETETIQRSQTDDDLLIQDEIRNL